MKSNKCDYPEEFNVNDYNMAFFLSQTAIQIDNYIIKKNKGDLRLDKVKGLGEILSKATDEIKRNKGSGLLGFDNWFLFYNAFKSPLVEYTEKPLEEMDVDKINESLAQGVSEVSKDLETLAYMPEKNSIESIEKLRSFCNELCKNILSYESRFINQRRIDYHSTG